MQCIESSGMSDILQIEHKILTPADLRIHLQVMFHDNIPPVQLVPQYTVIKICRFFHHAAHKRFLIHHAIDFDISFMRQPLPDHPIKISNHKIRLFLFCRPHQKFRRIRCDPVITVQKLQILPVCLSNRHISALRHTGILLVDHQDPVIRSSVPFTDFPGFIAAAVIDQKQFKIFIFLFQHTVHASFQCLFSIINRNDNTYCRFHSF